MSKTKSIPIQQNIMQITNLVDLKYIMSSCVTVIVAFTTPVTSNDLRIFIRTFLKEKSKNTEEIMVFVEQDFQKIKEKVNTLLNNKILT